MPDVKDTESGLPLSDSRLATTDRNKIWSAAVIDVVKI